MRNAPAFLHRGSHPLKQRLNTDPRLGEAPSCTGQGQRAFSYMDHTNAQADIDGLQARNRKLGAELARAGHIGRELSFRCSLDKLTDSPVAA